MLRTPAGVRALAKACSDPARSVRMAALQNIRHAPRIVGSNLSEVVAALEQATYDADSEIRRNATGALWHFGSSARALVPRLIQLLKDPEPWVRYWAAIALGFMGEDAAPAIPILQWLIVHDEEAKPAALDALAHIGPNHPDVLPTILAAYRRGACTVDPFRALRQFKGDVTPVLPVLIQIARDEDPVFACQAIDFLAELGPAAQDAIPVLTDCLRDENWRIRKSAAQALQRIQGNQ